jgi:glycosyltransferase involved in cell wall biosynthesis
MCEISHFVGLSGIGGVQRNFIEYLDFVNSNKDGFRHKVYTFGKVDLQYKLPVKVYNVKELKNLFALIVDIVSRHKIVHFYNNLTSLKLATLLFILPVHNIVLHERGIIWNHLSSRGILLRFVAWKASLILANSNATKTMLIKKFYISNEKIRVLHNGINTTVKCIKQLKDNRSSFFRVGFIGRLDTPKGTHVLIDAMHQLIDNKIELIIAGDGILEKALKKQADNLKNISFVGRIESPYVFLSDIDLLVVPSIREPLGNVCLEAGLCKVPVLASNVDGIPEIIMNGITGELIDATDEISINSPEGAVPLPEFVVDSVTESIHTPRQINSKLLAKKILELSQEKEILTEYAEQLHKRVISCFSMDRYVRDLHKIYKMLNNE